MASPAVAPATALESFAQATTIPAAFVWPELQKSDAGRVEKQPVMDIPTVDLSLFRRTTTTSTSNADSTTTALAADQQLVAALQLAGRAASTMGFFHVVNHGVDASLVEAAHRHSERLFSLPLERKQMAKRLPGESFGYSSSFAERFSSRLPWKETFSAQSTPVSTIAHYCELVLGDDDEHLHASSSTFEKYCEAMAKIGFEVLEVLELALGVQRGTLQRYFEDYSSILRLNYYPSCRQPSLTFGTGPHTDPVGLTILHQDEVAGLQVLYDDTWYTVPPRKDAFFINIGDTLMALSNKRFKSGVHRALVNSFAGRKSMAFFFNPPYEATLSPPEELVDESNPRAYQDFTWGKLLYFTQSVYRTGVNSIDDFNEWQSK
uniref:Gibberellin 20 oxidase n=1 Tax=Lygodium japonicum TaxID=13824 RepID=A0A0B6VNM7_LYGJA|nr:gibberellin 20 oxidase [Lygodium japonicum]